MMNGGLYLCSSFFLTAGSMFFYGVFLQMFDLIRGRCLALRILGGETADGVLMINRL
jgi:hypothetical protein